MSPRPMATSSDIILTSRHSSSMADLTNGSSDDVLKPSKPSRAKKPDSYDNNANAAACYGVDTAHSWATVSAGSDGALRRQQLSGWRSDVALYSGSQTVSLDTSPVHGTQLHQTELTRSTTFSIEPPKPPPRTKHKARAALSVAVGTSPDSGTRPCHVTKTRHVTNWNMLTSVVEINEVAGDKITH